MSAFLGDSRAAVVETFTPMLELDRNALQTVPPASGSVVVGEKVGAVHVEGVVKAIDIPAGNATDLILADNLNSKGPDAFDATKDSRLIVGYSQAQLQSALFTLVREASAPVVSSASVANANPDRLVVVFDHVMWAASVAGLTLSLSPGAACAITAILSGLGTTTLTFQLSRSIVALDGMTLVYSSSNAVQSVNGKALAAGSHAVTNNVGFALVGEWAKWDATSITLSGTDVTGWTDSIGGFVMLPPAAKPVYSATEIDSLPGFHFITSSYLKCDTISRNDAEWTACGIFQFASGSASQVLFEASAGSADANGVQVLFVSGGTMFYGAGDGTNRATGAFTSTSFFRWLVRAKAARREIWINGSLLGSNTVSATPGAFTRVAMGIFSDLSQFPALNCKAGYLHLAGSGAGAGGYCADQKVTDWFSYANARWA